MSRNNKRNRQRAETYEPEDYSSGFAYASVAYSLTEYPEYAMNTEETLQPSGSSATMGLNNYPDTRLEQGMDNLSFGDEAVYTTYSQYAQGESASYDDGTIDPAAFDTLRAHNDLYATAESYDYNNTTANATTSSFADQASGSSYQQTAEPEKQTKFQCQEPNCTKAFRRTADLERHFNHVHGEESRREYNSCDYPKCQRRNDPFSRKDHLRDHLRDFHKEDIPRKTKEPRVDEKWWGSRIVLPKWWRCSRCLTRTSIDDDGWDCPKCKIACEKERRQLRAGTR